MKTEVISVSEMLLTTCQTVWCHRARHNMKKDSLCVFFTLQHDSENAASVTIHHVVYWIIIKLIKGLTDIIM